MKKNESYCWIRPEKVKIRKRMWMNHRAAVLAVLLVIAPMALMAAVTQTDLATQVKNLLPAANGGLNANASAFTGVLRDSSGTATASELSGDCTTSGSNVVTCQKVNGNSVPSGAAADQALIGTAANTFSLKTLPDCPSGALNYTQSTHAFACASILTGTFADAETPSGTVNGSNVTFTLAHTPSPAASLDCNENGVGQRAAGADYTLATATITYGVAPPTGTTLSCNYRY